ncbi:MAG: hypothetical protein IH983_08015 [Planctomycetes bacterium]|nr:hypothetical protein [Planctomycetota bacterium]
MHDNDTCEPHGDQPSFLRRLAPPPFPPLGEYIEFRSVDGARGIVEVMIRVGKGWRGRRTGPILSVRDRVEMLEGLCRDAHAATHHLDGLDDMLFRDLKTIARRVFIWPED